MIHRISPNHTHDQAECMIELVSLHKVRALCNCEQKKKQNLNVNGPTCRATVFVQCALSL